MTRRTKIVATIGPASQSGKAIHDLINAGVNVFRLNFSHGSVDDHLAVAGEIRQQAEALDQHIGILADLQGPKIRIGSFREGSVELAVGDSFILDTSLADGDGTAERVGLEYETLCSQVGPDDILLLDDGRIRLKVDSVKGDCVNTQVTTGGTLSSRKGINRLGGGLAAPALTVKDIADIESLTRVRPDFVAVSFVSSATDIAQTKELLMEQKLEPAIIAKIERAEVVADEDTLTDILSASSGIMVARGDLGIEVGDASLIGIQKALISRARKMDRVVITATQMMESMISRPMPTRAEVFDVANAVLDGTDAVMLSAETAVGKYPVEVVEAMASTCLGAEQHPSTRVSKYRIDREFNTAQETIAMSAIYAANHHHSVRGIACLTETGTTPLLMSRLSSGLPIFALSGNIDPLRKLALCRGVIPLHFDAATVSNEDIDGHAIELLKSCGHLQENDEIILTKGMVMGQRGKTNLLKILQVP